MKERRDRWAGKVALGYCHTGIVHQPFMESVVSFMIRDGMDRKLVIGGGRIMATQSAYIPEARNTIVREFLEGDHEWLWFLDYDVDFPTDTLYKLIDAADPIERPIIGGLYFIRIDGVICPVFYSRTEGFLGPLTQFTTNEVVPITSTGLGCTLLHRSVFEYMRDATNDDGEPMWPGPWCWFGHDLIEYADGLSICGEDITFFRRCETLNIPVFGHTGVKLDHIKPDRLNLRTFAAQSEFVEAVEHQEAS